MKTSAQIFYIQCICYTSCAVNIIDLYSSMGKSPKRGTAGSKVTQVTTALESNSIHAWVCF